MAHSMIHSLQFTSYHTYNKTICNTPASDKINKNGSLEGKDVVLNILLANVWET